MIFDPNTEAPGLLESDGSVDRVESALRIFPKSATVEVKGCCTPREAEFPLLVTPEPEPPEHRTSHPPLFFDPNTEAPGLLEFDGSVERVESEFKPFA